MAVALKYKKAEYTAKINTLNDYYNRLNTHLENLEGYKNEIRNFWSGDENSERVYTILSDMIRSVRRAMERTQTTIEMCENIIEQIEASDNTVTNVIEEAWSIVKGLVDL